MHRISQRFLQLLPFIPFNTMEITMNFTKTPTPKQLNKSKKITDCNNVDSFKQRCQITTAAQRLIHTTSSGPFLTAANRLVQQNCFVPFLRLLLQLSFFLTAQIIPLSPTSCFVSQGYDRISDYQRGGRNSP